MSEEAANRFCCCCTVIRKTMRTWIKLASFLVSVMASTGHASFSIMGHDRGARVAYRMALDHPETIRRVAIIEIIPTSEMAT
jgi:pimeloyl-ACP methyl ester carboxylesterase